MPDKDKATILEGAKQAFFAAMLAGYANDGTTPTEGLVKTKTSDGYKTIEFTTGDYKVVDRYCTTPHSTRSSGTTTIFWKDNAVWWMSYWGKYPGHTISFLKAVLRETYLQGIFYGGRGGPYPVQDNRSGCWYRNIVRVLEFEDFSGHEEIRDSTTNIIGDIIGFHHYSGWSLIE